VKLSETEAKETFRLIRRQLTVEVVQLPTGEEGKKLADKVTVAMGQGGSLSGASKEAGLAPKRYGPFPLDSIPKDVPDPEAFWQGVSLMKPGEVSPLITGEKASYLIRLESQQDPPEADYEKEKEAFRTSLLLQKRTVVFADWLMQLRREAKVTVDQDSL